MKADITTILKQTPGLKGREIANKLGKEKRDVNSYLSRNLDHFIQDNQSRWYISGHRHIEFESDTWISSAAFEHALKQGQSPLEDNCSYVRISMPERASILLDATSRLIALSNQLVWKGKSVTIDFTACPTMRSYLNRIGFFDHLDQKVEVIPTRPRTSKAAAFKGNATSVYELNRIDIADLNEKIPAQLKASFIKYAGETNSLPVFTVLAELFGNVRDHSKSQIPGLAALQCYAKAKPPHIQTVISDSGEGIATTLAPALKTKYKALAKKIEKEGNAADAFLIKEIFEKGGISQFDGGHGIGLKASGDVAKKYNAKVTIRQETLEVTLTYKDGELANFFYILDMPKMFGTHICFDFLLDNIRDISLN
jgi:hypothetical protein